MATLQLNVLVLCWLDPTLRPLVDSIDTSIGPRIVSLATCCSKCVLIPASDNRLLIFVVHGCDYGFIHVLPSPHLLAAPPDGWLGR